MNYKNYLNFPGNRTSPYQKTLKRVGRVYAVLTRSWGGWEVSFLLLFFLLLFRNKRRRT